MQTPDIYIFKTYNELTPYTLLIKPPFFPFVHKKLLRYNAILSSKSLSLHERCDYSSSPAASPLIITTCPSQLTINRYPEALADKSFDNTGCMYETPIKPRRDVVAEKDVVLLEAPHRDHLQQSALITVDLTTAVADEAIRNKNSIIIAYRKFFFRGFFC
jgi:hypothetical protein